MCIASINNANINCYNGMSMINKDMNNGKHWTLTIEISILKHFTFLHKGMQLFLFFLSPSIVTDKSVKGFLSLL